MCVCVCVAKPVAVELRCHGGVMRQLLFLTGSSSFLQVTRTSMKAWMSWNLGRITLLTLEFAALERLKKATYNVYITLAPSFLIGSSSFLLVTRRLYNLR